MPTVHLSFDTDGGSRESDPRLLADRMLPYLDSNAIALQTEPRAARPDSVPQPDRDCDFHLILRSGGGETARAERGVAVLYPSGGGNRRGAEVIAENLRRIYPLPALVRTQRAAPGELRPYRAPAAAVELGGRDSEADGLWLKSHADAVAQQLVRGLTEFFGLPFLYPCGLGEGTVHVAYGALTLRDRPSHQGAVTAAMPGGAAVTVCGERQGWYAVRYGDSRGYAPAAYIAVRGRAD